MFWPTFKQTVKLTSLLNETVLPFNTWIISPKINPVPSSSKKLLPHPMICAALYATTESLCAWLIPQIALMPFIFVVGAGIIHLSLSSMTMDHTGMLIAAQPTPIPATGTEKAGTGTELSPPKLPEKEIKAFQRSLQVLSTLQIISAAASNASLGPFAESLETSFFDAEWMKILPVLAFLYSLLAHWADYTMTEYGDKSLWIGQHGFSIALEQILNLILLQGIRMGVRKGLGMPVLSVLETKSQAEMERLYGPERYPKVHESSPWVGPLCSALSIVSTVTSQWWWRRMQRKVEEGEYMDE